LNVQLIRKETGAVIFEQDTDYFTNFHLNSYVFSEDLKYTNLKKNDYFKIEIINLFGETIATSVLTLFDVNL